MQKEKTTTTSKKRRAGLRECELADLAALAGSSYCLNGPALGPEDLVIEGRVSVSKLRSGLVMHASETAEVHDLSMEVTLQPCLNVFLILEGGIEGKFNGEPFRFSALKDDGHTQPTGIAVAIAKPTKLMRQSRRGARTRKVNVQIQPQWLKDCGLDKKDEAEGISCFLKRHLARTTWRPSSRAVALAEQILNPPDLPPLVRELYLESRSIELAAEALQALSGDLMCPALNGGGISDISRARVVREYIEHNLGENLTLESISDACGIGISTLQRQFKSAYGRTVLDFVRTRRLEYARNAMETRGLSVSEAAYLVGYNNPANFATAFKRAFGISPSLVRR